MDVLSKRILIIIALFVLVACGNDSTPEPSIADTTPEPFMAENDSDISVFMSNVDISIAPELLREISFSVTPKINAISEPISAIYQIDDLEILDGDIKLPIFGLYSDYRNSVDITLTFTDGSTKVIPFITDTDPYIDVNDIYDDISVISAVIPDKRPSYDYIFIKGRVSGPIIMDIDGNIRWVGNEDINATSSYFENNGFKIGIDDRLITLSLDGSQSETTVVHEGLSEINFHHTLDKGKFGYLAQISATKDGNLLVDTVLLELGPNGETIKEWDFGLIFSEYMTSNGDDPTNFVRDGFDWLHTNSAVYDPSDDSLIVSSRENFVVKVDYDTNEIKWLLGDETKFWFTYPSLASLSLFSIDVKPIGQHALSIVNGELLLFNDGQISFQNPPSTSTGIKLSTSPSSRYLIDAESMTAEITWNYDPGLYSDICSSIYRDPSVEDGDYLVTYSVLDRLTESPVTALLHGVNEEQELLFAFQLNTNNCDAAWNSEPIDTLSNLIF